LTNSGLSKLKRGIKGILQMLLKHWQAWGINHLSRNPVPMFDHPFGKEMFPQVKFKPRWHTFEPFPRILSLDTRENCSAPASPLLFLRKL